MNYFVIYKGTGKKEMVPEAVANALFEAKSPKINWSTKLGKRQIDLATVGNIFAEEEYYLMSPEERPIKTETYKQLETPKYYNKAEKISALEKLIQGMEKFLKINPNANKAKALLEKMKYRLAVTKSGGEQKTTLNKIISF